MRIIIDATAAVSGGKLYLEKLISQFAATPSADQFVVIHGGDLDQLEAALRCDNIRFHRVDILSCFRLPATFTRLFPPGLWRMLWRKFFLPNLLDQLRPDLLFSNSAFVPPRRDRRFPTVIALHNSMPLRDELIAEETSWLLQLRLIWLRRMIHRSLQNCDTAIVFSHDTRRTIELKFPDVVKPLEVIHHGIDWQGGQGDNPDQTATPPSTRPPYLLYVSQFHRYKNVGRLLEAFAIIAGTFPDLQLVLIGDKADPAYWEEVESTIQHLKLETRVRYLPACPREELLSLYRNALAFVHPSLAETCSFPLLEALVLELPIAAARMSALPEIAADAAIYFDPYQPAEIAEVLSLIVSNEDLRQELSRLAKRRAAAFSWELSAHQTREVFERIVANSHQDEKMKKTVDRI